MICMRGRPIHHHPATAALENTRVDLGGEVDLCRHRLPHRAGHLVQRGEQPWLARRIEQRARRTETARPRNDGNRDQDGAEHAESDHPPRHVRNEEDRDESGNQPQGKDVEADGECDRQQCP